MSLLQGLAICLSCPLLWGCHHGKEENSSAHGHPFPFPLSHLYHHSSGLTWFSSQFAQGVPSALPTPKSGQFNCLYLIPLIINLLEWICQLLLTLQRNGASSYPQRTYKRHPMDQKTPFFASLGTMPSYLNWK